MKRRLLLATNIAGLILVLLVGVAGKMCYSAFTRSLTESISNSATSDEIIVGADGPTAIFVSGNFDLNTAALVLLLLLLLIGILLTFNVVYFIKKQ